MEVQQISLREDGVALVAKLTDSLEGAQVVAELSLRIAQLTVRQLFCQRECLFERERVTLDLDAGQGLLDLDLLPYLGDPLRP